MPTRRFVFSKKDAPDILQTRVNVAKIAELSMMGSAYLAGLGIGIWYDVQEIKDVIEPGTIYESNMNDELRLKNVSGWHKAVDSVLGKVFKNGG